MAQLTYRESVSLSIAQAMRKDPKVFFIGEDVGAAGGVFKATVGLLDEFGKDRVMDTPISEQAILGAAMGAAMAGLRPIAEIMFSDFLAVCWDIVANQIAKTRYMSDGQINIPLVIRTANGGGYAVGSPSFPRFGGRLGLYGRTRPFAGCRAGGPGESDQHGQRRGLERLSGGNGVSRREPPRVTYVSAEVRGRSRP